MDITTPASTFMATFLAIGVMLTPFAAIAALLRLAERIAERRDARYARQIGLTDAIHRELGAIVAPTVRRRRGSWLISMTAPLDPPGALATILRITDERFGAEAGGNGAAYEVVLTWPSGHTKAGASRVARPPVKTAAQLAA